MHHTLDPIHFAHLRDLRLAADRGEHLVPHLHTERVGAQVAQVVAVFIVEGNTLDNEVVPIDGMGPSLAFAISHSCQDDKSDRRHGVEDG